MTGTPPFYLLIKNLIFRERVVVPHNLEISASQEDGIIPEIKTSKPGQPDPAPSEKKFSRLSLSKREKKARKYIRYTLTSGLSTYSMKLGNGTGGMLRIFSPRCETI